MDGINKNTIKRYLHILHAREESNEVIVRKIQSLIKFFTWALKRKLISQSVYQQIIKEIDNFKDQFLKAEVVFSSEKKTPSIMDFDKAAYAGEKKTQGIFGEISIRFHLQSYKIRSFLIGVLKRIPLFGKKLSFSPPSSPILNFKDWLLNYIGVLILLLFISFIGAGLYNRFFLKVERPLAYPLTPVRAGRTLNFQGRLTDSLGNPITSSTNVQFRLYNVPTGGTALYQTGACAIIPDQDGIFNVIIGSDCGSEIPNSIFTENPNIYLGVTVGADNEMTPRQAIANIGYAINAETLQGLPPGTSLANIPFINKDGDLLIAVATPGIRSTYASTNFSISSAGTAILQSASAGDVVLQATESGTIRLRTGGMDDSYTRLFVNNAGNVGIGTTTPNNLLEVYDLVSFSNTNGRTSIGYQAGKYDLGQFNTWLGYQAGSADNATGNTANADYNTGIGYQALYSNTTGFSNSAQGASALYSNTTGYRNSAQGAYALFSNTTGYYNSAQGAYALYSNTAGFRNSAQGAYALFSNTTGYYNSAQGALALFTNTTGYYNSAQGAYALFSNTSGYFNSAQGANALSANTTGYSNTAIGFNAGRYISGGLLPNQTSNTSLYLGAETKALADGNTNEIVIGYNTTGFGSNTAAYGNANMAAHIFQAGNVGIGTTSPLYNLDVSGTGRFTGNLTLDSVSSVADNNMVLTTDSGVVRYVDTSNWDKDSSNDVSTFLGLTDTPSSYTGYGGYFVRVNSGATGLEFATTSSLSPWTENSSVVYLYTPANNVSIGDTTSEHKLEVEGAITGKALVSLWEKGDQDILVASNSATPTNVFRLTNNGSIISSGNITASTTDTINGLSISSASLTDVVNITMSGTLDLGVNTIYDGNLTGNWNFNSGNLSGINNLTSSGTITFSGLTATGPVYTTTGGVLNSETYLSPARGGTGDDTSTTTGVPYISSGNWLYESSLNVARGGTGLSSLASGSLIYGSGSSPVNTLAIGSANYVLVSNGTAPIWSTISGSSITPDSLDFSEFMDNMTLDANLTISASASNYSINIDSGTLFVDSANDRVGIGTTGPNYTLEVNGTFRASGNSYFGSNVYFANGTTYYVDSSGNARFLDLIAADTGNPGLTIGNGSIGFLRIGSSTIFDNNTSYLSFDPNSDSTPEMVITDTGNVGIGTTGPSYKLDVAGGIRVMSGGGELRTWGQADIEFTGGSDSIWTMKHIGVGTKWMYYGDGTTWSTRIRADTGEAHLGIGGGNVGIGTTTPGGNLHIGGTTYGQDRLNIIKIGEAGTATSDYQLLHDNSGAFGRNTLAWHVKSDAAFGVMSSGWDKLWEVEGGTGRMYVKGNVGIGTTAPSYKLDVQGGAIASTGYLPRTANWNTYGTGDGGAAIYNDAGSYQALMIVGADRGQGYNRWVRVWDSLWVNSRMDSPVYYDSNNTGYYVDPNGNSQVSSIYANNWFRAQGTSGLYFQDYGGGWHMSDTWWIRTYNSKSVWTNSGLLGSNGGLTVGYNGTTPPYGGAIIAGNVGIGTTGPTAKLHIVQTTAPGNPTGGGVYVYNNATNGNAILAARVSSAAGDPFLSFDIEGVYGWAIGLDDADNKFKITRSWNFDTTRTALTIDTNGNVGIGTTTPGVKLHVKDGTLLQETGAGTWNWIEVRRNEATLDRLYFGSDSNNRGIWSLGGRDFGIYTEGVNRLMIKANGNVGIGTTTPNNLLEVYDLISFSNPNRRTSIGYQAGKYDLGQFNTWLGYQAGSADSATGKTDAADYNTGIGYQALFFNDTGNYNTAQGANALRDNSTGYYNTAQGANALYSNVIGYYNTAQGANALYFNDSGNFNTAQGTFALYSNTYGYYNTAIGYNAGSYTSGGSPNQTSNTSLYLGAQTKAGFNGASNEIVIGYNTTGFGSNTAAYGNAGMTRHIFQAGNVGIGTTTPNQKLDVSGNIRANGEIIGTLSGYGQFRAIAGNYGAMIRNDGTNTFFLLTDYGDPYGTWNYLRPFYINNGYGHVYVGYNALFVQYAGYVGIGTTTPLYRLELPNSADPGGRGRANAWVTYSDIRLKENIAPIENALDKVLSIRGVTFDWIGQGVHSSGFIAQEVEEIIPELVTTSNDGLKSLDYGRFTPYLVEAIKQQQNQISSLSVQLADLSLTSTGDLEITKTNTDHANNYVYDGNDIQSQISDLKTQNYTLIRQTTDEVIQRLAAFSELVAAKIKAGLIETKDAVVNNVMVAKTIVAENLSITTQNITIAGKTLAQYIDERVNNILNTRQLLSLTEKITTPVLETEEIRFNQNSRLRQSSGEQAKLSIVDKNDQPTAEFDTQNQQTSIFGSLEVKNDENKGKLAEIVIKGLEGKTVARIDASGSAYFAGSLTTSTDLSVGQNATVSGSLTASDASISGKLAAREVEAENISALENSVASVSSSMDLISSDINQIQQLLAEIKNQPLPDPTNQTNLSTTANLNELTVTGNTNLYNVSVANSLLVGNLLFENDKILSLSWELKLSALSQINLFDGAVTIAKDGTITTKGALIAEGGIKTNTLSSQSGSDLSVLSDLNILGDLKLQKATNSAVIAASENFEKHGLFAPAIETASASAGIGKIPMHQNEVIIYNERVKPDSLIYITQQGQPTSEKLTVKEKKDGYFKVARDQILPIESWFDWLVIN